MSMNSAWHIHKEIKKNLKIDAEMNEDKVMYNFCRLVDRMDAVSYFMDKIYISGWQRYKCLFLVIVVTLLPVSYSVESINIYVPEGGTIELKCPYLSTSTPVIWQSTHGLLFDGREVDHSLRIQNKMATVGNITIGQFNLKIFNVSSADVGYYVCGTYFGNETHQTRFNVHLAAEISNLTIQTTSQGFLHGTTGVEMSIVCSVCGGIPLRNLSMELDVEEEVVFNTSGRNLYYTFIPDATMHLMNITCRGYDILFEKSIKESITLNITYPPIVKLTATPSTMVKEGSAVTLLCNHNSNPETKDVKWTKDEKSYQKFNFRTKIVFRQTSREDAGNYECSVCNELGRTSVSLKLIVLYAPSVSVTILQNGSLLCNATGVPNVYRFSKWEHLSEFGEHIRFLNGLNAGSLNILPDSNSVNYLKNGKYICTVHNGISNRFQEVNQTGYILLQFQERPFCLNTSVHTMTNVDNEDILNVKIAVDAVSIPIYNNFQWRHRNQVLQTNLTRYTMASIETLIPTDIYGQLVRISAYRFTLAFTAFQIENYGEYSIVISNKNGTSICSANEQQKSIVVSKDSVGRSVWKANLYYGIIPACCLAASGWIALFIYCRKWHQMYNTGSDTERQQSQQLQYVTNYYDEINENELLNLSSIRPSFHFSDRSEISSRTTTSNYESPELLNSISTDPYQQLVGHLTTSCHSYATLTIPHDYFVVIDSNISNSSNLKRHTY